MSRTVKVYINDEVYAALRREADHLAARPTIEEWLARTRRQQAEITTTEVIAALDELRGPWSES